VPKKRPPVKERVRDYLRANDMTQEQLAEQVGVVPGHLSDILNGKTPSLPVAVRLENLTGIPARDFAEVA
jgi:transcriptional regulator with XRE-family HTH domain